MDFENEKGFPPLGPVRPKLPDVNGARGFSQNSTLDSTMSFLLISKKILPRFLAFAPLRNVGGGNRSCRLLKITRDREGRTVHARTR